jgi:hypothetical protein
VSSDLRADGDLAGTCVPMFLKEHRPPEPGRSSVFMYGRDYYLGADQWVEIWTVTGEHTMMPGTAPGEEQIVHLGPDGHRGGPYPKYHHAADNLMFFYGTDPDNPEDLGAHVEFHLGEGASEQVFRFGEPRCIVIPKGVRHFPMIVTEFRRNFVIFDVLLAPTRQAAGTETDFSYVRDDRGRA